MLCLLITIFSYSCLTRLSTTTACSSPVKGRGTRNKWFPLPKQELRSASHLASLVIAIVRLVQFVCTNLFWFLSRLARSELMAQSLTNVLESLDDEVEDGEVAIEGEFRMFLLVTCRLMTGESA
jgi:hypothetical protein